MIHILNIYILLYLHYYGTSAENVTVPCLFIFYFIYITTRRTKLWIIVWFIYILLYLHYYKVRQISLHSKQINLYSTLFTLLPSKLYLSAISELNLYSTLFTLLRDQKTVLSVEYSLNAGGDKPQTTDQKTVLSVEYATFIFYFIYITTFWFFNCIHLSRIYILLYLHYYYRKRFGELVESDLYSTLFTLLPYQVNNLLIQKIIIYILLYLHYYLCFLHIFLYYHKHLYSTLFTLLRICFSY